MCKTCTVEEAARREVVEAILSLNHAAKRCIPKTHLFAHEALTQWDRRHADIDALLYWLQVSTHMLAECEGKSEVIA